MAEWSEYPLNDSSEKEDRYFLLLKQEGEYEKIRDRANRTRGFVLSVVSLVASFGLIQYVFTDGFRPTTLGIPRWLANLCSPNALTFSNTVLNFDGAYISVALIFFSHYSS
jgi:hypothetical protein